jgi:hypothetical protein
MKKTGIATVTVVAIAFALRLLRLNLIITTMRRMRPLKENLGSILKTMWLLRWRTMAMDMQKYLT